jgi:homoserine dehydrogenase
MGATNALTIRTDALGEMTIVGPGAGRTQTGFAMLNDLLRIAPTRSR